MSQLAAATVCSWIFKIEHLDVAVFRRTRYDPHIQTCSLPLKKEESGLRVQPVEYDDGFNRFKQSIYALFPSTTTILSPRSRFLLSARR